MVKDSNFIKPLRWPSSNFLHIYGFFAAKMHKHAFKAVQKESIFNKFLFLPASDKFNLVTNQFYTKGQRWL